MDINFRFTTKTGEYPGAYFCDYFKDDGYQRALESDDWTIAHEILEYTYLGPDGDGVGVKWEVIADESADIQP